MYAHLFNHFLKSGDSLQVYAGNELLFASDKDGLLPLLEYADKFSPHHRQVTIFDKIMGNAVALLSIKVGCREVHSPLGSQLAVKTLDEYGIRYNLVEIVPYIRRPSGDMCPMERLSIGKDPEEFYEAVSSIIRYQ